MNILKTLFDFYINASIHVALSVYCLVRITEIYSGLPLHDSSLGLFIFCVSILGYNFIKYIDFIIGIKDLTLSLKSIQFFSLICFIFACYCGFQISFNTILFFIPFGLLSIFYATPFLKGFTKNLRSIAYIKIGIIAFVWSGITVILPILDAQKTIDLKVFLLFLQRFLVVVVLTIPFDIRDYKLDSSSLKTLPQILGVKATKKTGYILVLFSLFLEFVIGPSFYVNVVFLTISILSAFFLSKSSGEQSKYYSSFWVEAIPIFWFVLLWLARYSV